MLRKISIFLLFLSVPFFDVNDYQSNKSYIAGDDGVIRMYVNVIGNVKSPGTFLVYDGIDLLNLISLAGGYLDGSNINNIIVLSTDGSKQSINLDQILNSNIPNQNYIFKPQDTIYIKEKFLSKIVFSSNLPQLLLSLLNIALTLERTK